MAGTQSRPLLHPLGRSDSLARYQGRHFTDLYERHRIDRDVRQEQEDHGTVVLWFYYAPDLTIENDVYDEGDSVLGGRRWKLPPLRVPVLSANRVEGSRQETDYGFYTVDTIQIRISMQQSLDAGLMPELSLNTDLHLQDRVVYDKRVFGLSDLAITGQFDAAGHDIMVRASGTRVRPDELVNDPDFKEFA